MNNKIKKENELLLDEVGLYLSFATEAYKDGKHFIITEAHKLINKLDYEDEYEYYSELTDYIFSKL